MTEGLIKLCSDNGVDPDYMRGFIKACEANGVDPDVFIKDAQFWTEMKRMGRDVMDWGKDKWKNMGAAGKGALGGAGIGGAIGGLPGAMIGGTIGGLGGAYKGLLDSAGDASGEINKRFGAPVQGGINQAQANRRAEGMQASQFNAMSVPQRLQQYGTRDYNQTPMGQARAARYAPGMQAGAQGGMIAGGMSPMGGMMQMAGQGMQQAQNPQFGYQTAQSNPQGYYGGANARQLSNPYMF